MLRRNRPLVLLCVTCLLFLTGMFSTQTVAVFYARDVLGNADLYIVMTAASTVAMITASALTPKAVQTVGKKNAYLFASVVGATGAVGFGLAPGSTPAIGIVFYTILGFGLGTINTLIFALQAATVDYGEWKAVFEPKAPAIRYCPSPARSARGSAEVSPPTSSGSGVCVRGEPPERRGRALDSCCSGYFPALLMVAAGAVMLVYPLTEAVFRSHCG
jgi:glucuronide carrier protein